MSEKRFVTIVGDSISTFEGFNPPEYAVYYDKVQQYRMGFSSVYDTWWAKVNQYLKAYLCVNSSYSGSRVSGAQFPSASCESRTSRLHTEQYMPDLILVYIGVNDYGYGVPIFRQTANQKETDFFYDSYRKMIRDMKKNYPQAEIICSTFLRGFVEDEPNWRFPEYLHQIAFSEYDNAVRKAAWEEKVKLIDPAAKHYAYETLDGTHPTVAGHAMIANAWIECLKELNY